jgi:haloalkane dehalogenase
MDIVSTPESAFDDVPDYDYEPRYVAADAPGDPELAYVDTDPEGDSDETFLCLHGEPTWGYLYRKMVPALAERGRVVVPDFLGFGRSDKYTDRDAYTFDLHYDSLAGVVETLDLTGVTLVCQDWGSILGLPYAVSDAPERFDRIVAMNALLTDGETALPDTWYAFRDMVVDADELDVSRVVDGGCVTDLSAEVRAGYDAPFPNEASKAGAYAWPPMVPQDASMPGADRHAQLREDLGEWEKPFLALFADSDPITEQFHDLFRDLVPTADDEPDVWVEGAAHFIQEDAGERCAEHIVDFVNRH